MIDLVPTKATFAPNEPVEVEVRGADGATSVSLWRLERKVAEACADDGAACFPAQPEGGYGVAAGVARSALDVLADPLSRARYGFVSDFRAGRRADGVAANIRRLHLNVVQFYDWMYRHARLLPPDDGFVDALGRTLSLDSVRRLAGAVREVGSLPMGYAAVYAAGAEEWPEWRDEGLYRANGKPWTLGDFLWNVDPTAERWQRHFVADLQASAAHAGFAGFHLDQYGAPKIAFRRDGSVVDLAEAFPALIKQLAAELPGSRLIFNNVNDFPTWTTADAAQDAVYIEVWPPHERLADLVHLIGKAHSYAPGKSVVLAAYLSCFASEADERRTCAAQTLLLATAFSHGASVLLHGEEQAVLTEAYYVKHKTLSDECEETARRYYDFAVRYGDLLFDRDAVDVTRTHTGGVNEEIRLSAPAPVAFEAAPGVLWARIVRLSGGLLLNLIDLSAQDDDHWDAPKRPAEPLAGVRIAIERRTVAPPRVLLGSPEDQPDLLELDCDWDGRYDSVRLPPFRTWALLWLPAEVTA